MVVRRFLSVLFVTALAVLSGVGMAVESDLEQRARGVEGKLMAPCCMANTLAEHSSPLALQMRREIREMLANGATEQEILDRYVAEHGELILAAPVARGFNLTAYLLPLLFLIGGSLAVVLMVRKWSRPSTVAADRAPPAEIEPEYAERLNRTLREAD